MGPALRTLVAEVNWIGDVLLSTPLLRALSAASGGGGVDCLVHPRCEAVLRRNPHVRRLVLYDERAPLWSARGWFAALSALRRLRPQRAILLHASRSKAALCRAAGADETIAYALKTNPFLTRAVPPPADALHRTDVYLGLLGPLGVPALGREPVFVPSPEADAELDGLLREAGADPASPLVAVHAGGNWELKRWPAGHFKDWIRLLRRSYSGTVVLCGTLAEEGLARQILEGSRSDRGAVSLCGRTSLDVLARLFRRARLVVTNDSGPIHLAASQGARILGLFGPTAPEQTGPTGPGRTRILRRDVGCEVPCYFRSCRPRACMEWIRPEEAARAALELLDDTR